MNRPFLDHLKEVYGQLSKSQKTVADYILNNYDKAVHMNAYELAEATGVSQSTAVRFAWALGYDGYPQMRRALRDSLPMKMTTVERLNMMEGLSSEEILKTSFDIDVSNLRTTQRLNESQTIDEAVEAMNGARRLYLVGTRSSWPLVQFLDYYLRYMMDNVHLIRFEGSDVFSQTLGCGPMDAALTISFPRYSSRTMDVIRFLKAKSVKILCLTDNMASPPAKLADCVLLAKSYMNSFVDSFVAPLALINALIVDLGLKRKDKLFENFAQLETIWEDAHTYAVDQKGATESD